MKLCVQTFQPLISIYRRDNFVYYQWGYTSISWLLSYHFRSLSTKYWKRFLIRWLNNFEDFNSSVKVEHLPFYIFLFVRLTTFGTLIGCIMKLCVKTFQPLILIYRISWPLSYLFRSLSGCTQRFINFYWLYHEDVCLNISTNNFNLQKG